MNHFSSILNELNKKLDLPQPTKSKILIEVSADLNDLFEYYFDRGNTEQESIKKATEKLNLTDETIQELIKIHESGFYKWFKKLSDRTRNRWEKISLIIILLFLTFFISRLILTEGFFLQASIFMLPVVGIFLAALILSMFKYFKIYIQKDHNINRLRTKLPTILFLGGASLLVGVIGFFIDLFITVSKISTDLENYLIYFVQWLVRSSAHLMITLIITIIISVLWFIFYNKVLKIETVSAAHLINE